ncbi:hypothetical protein MRX96_034442 [Rhipicephalus microplus]
MAPGAGTRPRLGHRPEPRMRAGCTPWGGRISHFPIFQQERQPTKQRSDEPNAPGGEQARENDFPEGQAKTERRVRDRGRNVPRGLRRFRLHALGYVDTLMDFALASQIYDFVRSLAADSEC